LARRFGCPAFLLFGLLALQGCGKEPPPPPVQQAHKVKLLTLGEGGLPKGKEYPGRTEASQTAELSFRVSGPLKEMPAQQGMVVEQGTLLARIDPRDFQTQVKDIGSQLDQANVELTRMKAGARPEDITRLEASLAGRKAEFEQRRLTEQRYREMVNKKVVSQQEYDTVKAAFDVAASNLKNAEQELDIGRKGARAEDIQAQQAKIEGLQAQMKQAEAALSDTELKAPFSGVVARTYVKNFEDVQAKQPILSMQDISRIDIKIYISESDLGRGLRSRSISDSARNLQAEAVFAQHTGKTFPLTVKEYQTEADPKTQTFEITFQMKNPPDHPVMPGMNATVRQSMSASGPARQSGFMVPVEAVFADSSGGQNVWVADPATQKVSRRPVKTGEIGDGQIRVTDGLKSGDIIAVSAVNMLSEGMKVAPMSDLRGL